MSPVAINGVDEQGVVVNGVQVKQALDPANEIVSKGVYDPTTLSAVEVDLVTGNIRDGVTIFGFAGTVTPGSLAEDVEGDTVRADVVDSASVGKEKYLPEIGAGVEMSLVLKNLTFDASSIAFAAGFASVSSREVNSMKLQLYMGGVLMQTSVYVIVVSTTKNYVLRDFKVLSGSQDCELKGWNDSGANSRFIFWGGIDATSEQAAAIAVGSIKLT